MREEAAQDIVASDMASSVGISAPTTSVSDLQDSVVMTYLEGDTVSNCLKDKPDSPISVFKAGLMHTDSDTLSRALTREDTTKIAAFDFLTGNYDRHTSNLLYDEKADKFSAIDQEASFSVPVRDPKTDTSQSALDDQLTKVLSEPNTPANLSVFKATINELMDRYSPEDVAQRISDHTVALGAKKPDLDDLIYKISSRYEAVKNSISRIP